jgi:hypothetical protein
LFNKQLFLLSIFPFGTDSFTLLSLALCNNKLIINSLLQTELSNWKETMNFLHLFTKHLIHL